MFLSGHPLDHYRFEMKHYGVTSIADFNEFKEAIKLQSNPGQDVPDPGLGNGCAAPGSAKKR